MEIPDSPGTYVIVALLYKETLLELKTFGNYWMPAGVYFYCGSACGPGGLKARVGRHLRKGTKKFWHFDHLKDLVDIKQVWWQPGRQNNECLFAQSIAAREGITIPVPGFGASDCHNGCPAHLLHYAESSSMDRLFHVLRAEYGNFQRKIVKHK
jgi:Uri superfamily endonuclease